MNCYLNILNIIYIKIKKKLNFKTSLRSTGAFYIHRLIKKYSCSEDYTEYVALYAYYNILPYTNIICITTTKMNIMTCIDVLCPSALNAISSRRRCIVVVPFHDDFVTILRQCAAFFNSDHIIDI